MDFSEEELTTDRVFQSRTIITCHKRQKHFRITPFSHVTGMSWVSPVINLCPPSNGNPHYRTAQHVNNYYKKKKTMQKNTTDALNCHTFLIVKCNTSPLWLCHDVCVPPADVGPGQAGGVIFFRERNLLGHHLGRETHGGGGGKLSPR